MKNLNRSLNDKKKATEWQQKTVNLSQRRCLWYLWPAGNGDAVQQSSWRPSQPLYHWRQAHVSTACRIKLIITKSWRSVSRISSNCSQVDAGRWQTMTFQGLKSLHFQNSLYWPAEYLLHSVTSVILAPETPWLKFPLVVCIYYTLHRTSESVTAEQTLVHLASVLQVTAMVPRRSN